MKTVESMTAQEVLEVVIEVAFAGVCQMPLHRETEAERAVCCIERLLKAGWKLRPPEDTPR